MRIEQDALTNAPDHWAVALDELGERRVIAAPAEQFQQFAVGRIERAPGRKCAGAAQQVVHHCRVHGYPFQESALSTVLVPARGDPDEEILEKTDRGYGLDRLRDP